MHEVLDGRVNPQAGAVDVVMGRGDVAAAGVVMAGDDAITDRTIRLGWSRNIIVVLLGVDCLTWLLARRWTLPASALDRYVKRWVRWTTSGGLLAFANPAKRLLHAIVACFYSQRCRFGCGSA